MNTDTMKVLNLTNAQMRAIKHMLETHARHWTQDETAGTEYMENQETHVRVDRRLVGLDIIEYWIATWEEEEE